MNKEKKNKETFELELDGKTVKLAVRKPTAALIREAQMEYNRKFADLLKQGAVLNLTLDQQLRHQGVWDANKEAEDQKLREKLASAEKALASGDIKLSKAKELAVQMRRDRSEWRQLMSERIALQSHTAEAQAENARFNYLVARSLVYNDTGTCYYKTIDEYYEDSDSIIAITAALKLSTLMGQYDEDSESKLPENKFLKEWNFADDELRLINKDGHLVDADGRLIDENGNYVNADGHKVDINGDLIDEEGNYEVEFSPFLDDDGNPIFPPKVEVSMEIKTEVVEEPVVEPAVEPVVEPVAATTTPTVEVPPTE